MGRPDPRLHRVERASAAAPRDRRAVRRHRARRRPHLRRGRGGHLLPHERPARPGRPRDRHLARLPEPVRDRPGGRRRRDAPRAARGERLGPRPRPAAQPADAATTKLIVVNAPHNPTGMLPDRATFDGARPDRRGRRRAPADGRGLPPPRVRRGRSTAGRRRRHGPRHLARRDVQVVRDGRSARGLVGHPRSRPAGPLRGVQGLHDDLLGGAIGDPGPHRPALEGRRPRALSRDRGAPTSTGWTRSSRPGPDRFTLGPTTGRVGRVPAVDRPGRRDRRLGGRAGRGRRRAAAARLAVRVRREPLPARVRPDGPARGLDRLEAHAERTLR